MAALLVGRLAGNLVELKVSQLAAWKAGLLAVMTAEHWAGKSVADLAANWVYQRVVQRVVRKAVNLAMRWAAWRVVRMVAM